MNLSFKGWGRKRTGRFAVFLAKLIKRNYILLEDGFIRSVGLGVDGWEAFSIVEDDIGIYYDATAPSKLEKILKNHDFKNDQELIKTSKKAIELIKKLKISKYNLAKIELPEYLKEKKKRVLIVAQTKGDMSLKYGYANEENAKKMLLDAIKENQNAEIYLKVHPDVLSGKKESNIDIEFAKKYCKIITENIHPIVLLDAFDKVYTQTSQMGFEALLLDKEVYIYGTPFYVGWGIENIKWRIEENIKKEILKRRERKLSIEEVFSGAYILYSKYYNPYRKKESDIIDTIQTIHKYREQYMNNKQKKFFFGFSFWKRGFIKPFFRPYEKICFCKNLNEALKRGLDERSEIFIWGRKDYKEVEEFAEKNNIKLSYVEDGFIRSVSLGSDLTRPYSLVIDDKGLYFDATRPSRLEEILNDFKFDDELLKRAQNIKNFMIEKKISKYNPFDDKDFKIDTDKRIVLVVGQVEDDASIKYGGFGMTNLKLLQEVYEKRKGEFLIYKPHPDVFVGNRKGNIEDKTVLKYADFIAKDISLPVLLDVVDEVHTITSLSGFEGIIRGKDVYTYGMPFYAGWGLTIDKLKCERRKRKLSVDELVAGALILYPAYISPKTLEFCEPEVMIEELEEIKKRYAQSFVYKSFSNIRNFIFRKVQLVGKVIVGE